MPRPGEVRSGRDAGALARMHPLESVSPKPAVPGLIFVPHMGEECKVESNKGSIHSHFLLPLIFSFPISLPLTISSFHSQNKQLSLKHLAIWDLSPRRWLLFGGRSPWHPGRPGLSGAALKGQRWGHLACALWILMPCGWSLGNQCGQCWGPPRGR